MKKIKGTTNTGFAYEIDEEARDDMEILDGLIALSNGDLTAMPVVLVALLGEDQKKKLYDYCRTKSGRVSSKRVMEEVQNIITSIGESNSDTKNS